MLAICQELLSGEKAVDAPRDPDVLLLERVARRDKSAFRQLYLKYRGQVYQYVVRMVHQPSLADEVVNDVMLIVWQKAATFRGQSKVLTWILGIAYRKGLKSYKRAQRFSSKEDTDADINANSGRDHSLPENCLESREFREQINHCLGTLSMDHRSVVELTVLGYSYPEIALIVNCPVNTVKTRMFHARRQLRGHLQTTANQLIQVADHE